MEQASASRFDARAAVFGRDWRPAPNSGRWVATLAAILGVLAYAALLAGAWWCVLHLTPDQISVRLLGHTLAARNIHSRILGNALLLFALLPAALWIECLMVGWRASSTRALLVRPTASGRTDIAYFLAGQAHLTDALAKLMTFGVSVVSGLWLHDWLSAHLGITISAAAAPLPVQVGLYFFLYTFLDYWTHRLDHSRLFWPLHRYHHAAEEFNVITGARAHPAAFTAVFLINMPMAALGASPQVMIDVNVIVIALGFLIHSRIDSGWGWVGRYLVQSPTHHRLHHVLDISTQPVGHFAMAPVWDHLFGTWRGDADQSLVIGVDTPYRHGAWIAPDLLRDYWDFWKGFTPWGRQAG